MDIKSDISLKRYNTFGVDVLAKRFITIHTLDELQQLLAIEKDIFLISGGSNMLLTQDIKNLVVHLNTKGISIDREDDEFVHLTAQAGENWHDFVLWCISKNYGGLENLSLIPGCVGTAPIQNIGAYGVEVKNCIEKVTALEINSGKQHVFSNSECEFGYRNSIFKNSKKGKCILISVSFKLTKTHHQLHTEYGSISAALANKKISKPTIQDVSNAVIDIRKSKLPDPKIIGNSGSFFKNPIVTASHFNSLQLEHPGMPFYKVSDTEIKIPAGWLIEQCGFKGKRFGDAGVHKNQALVLVNYGSATGVEIYQLAQKIQQTVFDNFSIPLEIEVNII